MESEEMCEICEKLISAQSLQMHKIHCERNTIKCEICQKKISRFEKDKHEADEHSVKQCEYCQAQLEPSLLLAHECTKRPIMCEFCEASFPADQLPPHKIICGSRTEKCEKCGKFIMKIDFDNHSLSNCGNIEHVARELKRREEVSERVEINNKPSLLKSNHKSKSDDLFSPLVAASKPVKFGQQASEEKKINLATSTSFFNQIPIDMYEEGLKAEADFNLIHYNRTIGQQAGEEKQISNTSTSFFNQIPKEMYEEGLKAEAEFSVLHNNMASNSMSIRTNETAKQHRTIFRTNNSLESLEQDVLDAVILNSLNET